MFRSIGPVTTIRTNTMTSMTVGMYYAIWMMIVIWMFATTTNNHHSMTTTITTTSHRTP